MRALAAAILVLVLAAPAAAAPPDAGILVPGRTLGGLTLGATEAQVRAAWGSDFGLCRSCPAATWYFNFRRFQPQGAGVSFARGRLDALFTLWEPPGWRTTRYLTIDDAASRIQELYGPLPRAECIGYYALTLLRGRSLTIFYVVDEKVYGFALVRVGAPVCR